MKGTFQSAIRFTLMALFLLTMACNEVKVEREVDEPARSIDIARGIIDSSDLEPEISPSHLSLEEAAELARSSFRSRTTAEGDRVMRQGSPSESDIKTAESTARLFTSFILNPSYVQHHRIRLKKEMEDILVEFNWALWTLVQAPDFQLKPEWISWRDQYAALISDGCWQPELGRPSLQNCLNISFFKKDYRSALIFHSWLRDRVEPSLAQWLPDQTTASISSCLGVGVREETDRVVDLGAWARSYNLLDLRTERNADCQELLEDYYTFMKVIFGLRGSASLEAPLALSNLRFGIAWATYLERNKYKSMEIQEANQAFATDFQTQLNSLSERDRWSADSEGWQEYANLISDPEVFLCSRRSNTPFCRQMLSKAAGFIYNRDFGRQDCRHPTLNCSFVRAIELRMNETSKDQETLAIQGDRPVESDVDLDALTSVNAETERSLKNYFSKNYLQALDFLKMGERRRVFDNLKIRELNWRSEYFYLVDGLFHGHLWPKDAAQFWNELPLAQETFQTMHETIDAYVRMEVARLVVATNEYMTIFYRRRDEFTIQELVRKTVEESQDLTAKWFELHLRIAQINTFVDQSMRQYQDFYALNRMLNNLSKDVMYLSSFPNMMMLAFFMAEEDFKMEIRGFFGSFAITSKDIIKGLFWGNFRRPWFAFSYDNIGLDIYQIMFSFYYALKTEAFETFGRVMREEGAPQSYDTVQFFKTLVSQFLQDDIVSLRTSIRGVRELLNSPVVREADQICADLSAIEREWETSTPLENRQGYGTYPKDTAIVGIQDLDGYLFGGGFSTVNGNVPSGYFANLYSSPFVGLTSQLPRIRSVMKHNLIYVDSLLDMLRLHYDEKGRLASTTEAERRRMQQEIQTIVAFIEQQKARVSEALTWAFHVEEKYGDCVYKISAVQRNRLKAIFEEEKAYAENVYDLMTVLNRLIATQGVQAATTSRVAEVLGASNELEQGVSSSVRDRLRRAMESLTAFIGSSGVDPESASTVEALSTMLKIPYSEFTSLNLATIPTDRNTFCQPFGAQEYCGFDRLRINEDGGVVWEYQKVDFDFRVASYLKNGIAPFIRISMPSRFQDLQSISRKRVYQVIYRDQLQAHLEQVLRLHNDASGRFSEWVKYLQETKVLTDKLGFLTELYQMGEVELFEIQCLEDYYNQRGELPVASASALAAEDGESGDLEPSESEEPALSSGPENSQGMVAEADPGEPESEMDLDDPQASDVCRFRGKTRTSRVTPARLADSILNLTHLVGMDLEEAKLMEMMGRDTLFTHRFYQQVFLDAVNDRMERTIFERTFETLRGSSFHQQIAENYYRQFSTMGHILFEVPDRLACSIRENFKRSMEQNYFQAIIDFTEEARRREQLAEEEGSIRILYEVGRELNVRDANGDVEYLSRRKLEDYRISVEHFHREMTSGFYQNENIETRDGRRLLCQAVGESP